MRLKSKKNILYFLASGGAAGVITAFWGSKWLFYYFIGLFFSVLYKIIFQNKKELEKK